jgi:hypothetical protein
LVFKGFLQGSAIYLSWAGALLNYQRGCRPGRLTHDNAMGDQVSHIIGFFFRGETPAGYE